MYGHKRTRQKDNPDGRLDCIIPGWTVDPELPVPPGYAVNNVRAFDPALITSRRRIWA
jgi:hypothetical protein